MVEPWFDHVYGSIMVLLVGIKESTEHAKIQARFSLFMPPSSRQPHASFSRLYPIRKRKRGESGSGFMGRTEINRKMETGRKVEDEIIQSKILLML